MPTTSVGMAPSYLLFPIVADVQHEGRPRDEPQVDAVVVEDPLRIVRAARQVGLGQLGPKSGRLDQGRVGVGLPGTQFRDEPRNDLVAAERSEAALGRKDGRSIMHIEAKLSELKPGLLVVALRWLPKAIWGTKRVA